MSNNIDLIGSVLKTNRSKWIRGWYGSLSGAAGEFNLSLSATGPSIGEFFPCLQFNEMHIWAVAQQPGASFALLTALTVQLQRYSEFSQDFITFQTLNVGALTGGPGGVGTNTYSFGTVGQYTNFGDCCRIAVFGAGALPGAGQLHIMVGMKEI